MKFRMHVANENNPDGWWENHNLNCANAEEAARNMIAEFNATLHPGEPRRTLLGVEVLNPAPYTRHEWHRTNPITIRDRTGLYDAYQCTRCGITSKRRGLDSGIVRDQPFAAKVYEDCDTALAHLEKLANR